MEERNETLASEIYCDLKRELRFKNWLIVGLVLAIFIMALFHDWRWSQFETVSLDAGGGYSNYVTGENTGGVYNGENQSAPKEGRQG